MSTPVVGLDYQYTLDRESAFGTAVNTSPVAIPTENVDINHDPKHHAIPRARGLRGQHEDDSWNDTVNSIPTASTGFFATLGTQDWYPGCLQKSADWTQADDKHWVYYTANYSELPDFSADEGYFYTLAANNPVAEYDERIVSAISNSIKFSIDPEANEGALYCEMEWMGKSSEMGVTVSGTITRPSMTTLQKWSNISAVTFGATNITSDFYNYEITATNNAKFVPAGGSDNVALPRWEATGSFTILAGADAETLKGYVLSSSPTSAKFLSVQFGAGTTDGDTGLLSFAYLTGWSSDKSEEEKVTFEFEGVFGPDSAEYPLQVTVYEDNS